MPTSAAMVNEMTATKVHSRWSLPRLHSSAGPCRVAVSSVRRFLYRCISNARMAATMAAARILNQNTVTHEVGLSPRGPIGIGSANSRMPARPSIQRAAMPNSTPSAMTGMLARRWRSSCSRIQAVLPFRMAEVKENTIDRMTPSGSTSPHQANSGMASTIRVAPKRSKRGGMSCW